MKKTFTAIIVLVTLSLLSLLYIQITWINNAILLQVGTYERNIYKASLDVKEGIKDLIAKNVGYNPEKLAWEGEHPSSSKYLWSTLRHIDTKEIEEVIKESLKNHDIELPFEYKISEPSPWVLNCSKDYTIEMNEKAYITPLTYDDSYELYLYIRAPKNFIIYKTWGIIAASTIFSIIILSAFYLTIRTVLKQKKLSEMKTDFINNMTHEFKTPIATIKLAIDALQNEKVKQNPQQIEFYSKIIKEENDRMNKQVEKILENSISENKQIQIKLQKTDIHEIIKTAANNIVIRVTDEEGVIDQHLHAKSHEIFVDEVHFSNLITNLLDNAIKYSGNPRHIIIETSNGNNKNLVIKIKDNGIGMSKETLNHIFDKFYRAHTGDLHNVKGFGLGLNYVKSVVDAHAAKIKVESTQGKGSTFILDFPLIPKH